VPDHASRDSSVGIGEHTTSRWRVETECVYCIQKETIQTPCRLDCLIQRRASGRCFLLGVLALAGILGARLAFEQLLAI